MKDICCIGHVTKDKIVTPNRTVYMAGGTSFYFAYAINQLPKDVSFSLITAMDPTETEPVEKMRQAGIEVTLNPSRNTVFFENIYGENQNERKQRVLAKADPFTIRQLEHVEAKVYHLGSLLSDDFSPAEEHLLSEGERDGDGDHHGAEGATRGCETDTFVGSYRGNHHAGQRGFSDLCR